MASSSSSSTMVIKVKYGDTLRRFNAGVDENDQLDLDMGGLRFKILSLFNLQLDADIAMTYVDEDGDIVSLVDDDDLRDAMKQNMKFLRIDVQMKNDKTEKATPRSSGSSTPLRSPQALTAEIFKSVPEPYREVLSKVPLELAATPARLGASRPPVFAEIADYLSKMGLSSLLPDSNVQAGGVAGTKNDSSEKPSAQPGGSSSNKSRGKISGNGIEDVRLIPHLSRVEENVTEDVRSIPHFTRVDLNALPSECYPSGPTPMKFAPAGATSHTADGRKEAKKINGKSLGCDGSSGSDTPAMNANDTSNNRFNECPFSGTPIANDAAAPYHRLRHPFKRNHSEAMGGMFHTGVRCDGCGCHPIIGPRFKSIVQEDFDLCHICFESMGNVANYVRIDHPVNYRHPRSFKGMHEHPPWMGPPILPKILRNGGMKHGRPKLDSRFVLDVNVMDGTVMAPSTPFTKIWRMRNNGGLAWPKGTQLMWIGGDRFSKSASVEVEIPLHGVFADNELDIAVDFIAPETPGRYISYWRMASPAGQKFGQRVWVLIQVDSSLKDSLVESFQGLNLNLPPENMVNHPQHVGSDIFQPSSSNSVKEPAMPIPNELPENEQDLNFPINDSLLVGHSGPSRTAPVASSTVSYPTVDQSVPYLQSVPVPTVPVASLTVAYPSVDHSVPSLTAQVPSSTVTYPSVDVSAPTPPSPKSIPVVTAPASSEGTSSNNTVEDALMKELESMGFKQVDLNKEVLRRNEYDLEQSVEDLCEVDEWDPSLTVAYPSVDHSVPSLTAQVPSSTVTYPSVDVSAPTPPSPKSIPVVTAPASSEGTSSNNTVEDDLMKELESMGFKQVDLNKEVLRRNEYDLEQSVEDLCEVDEWDPILEELQEMGFSDLEMNKKLLVKNNGSIKRVVMDLINGDKV